MLHLETEVFFHGVKGCSRSDAQSTGAAHIIHFQSEPRYHSASSGTPAVGPAVGYSWRCLGWCWAVSKAELHILSWMWDRLVCNAENGDLMVLQLLHHRGEPVCELSSEFGWKPDPDPAEQGQLHLVPLLEVQHPFTGMLRGTYLPHHPHQGVCQVPRRCWCHGQGGRRAPGDIRHGQVAAPVLQGLITGINPALCTSSCPCLHLAPLCFFLPFLLTAGLWELQDDPFPNCVAWDAPA